MTKSDWHYPRRDYAENIYTLLADSPTAAVSLFGPRRTGKTEFLREDLAPLAHDKGHRIVYVSLWQTLDSPLAVILFAFDTALRKSKLTDRIGSAAMTLAPKLKLKPPGTGAEIEIDVGALRGKPQNNHLLLLDQYCEKLSNARKPAILLFDEFQELAHQDDAAPIIAALRTSLDTRRQKLLSVFTGSSQAGLRKVFSAKDAPFYRFATQMTLPRMDDGFVDHQLKVFKQRAKRKLDRATAIKVFDKVGHNPLFFQQWLIAMMAHTELSADEAIKTVLDDLGAQFGFEKTWEKLSLRQRAVARLLALRTDAIYGDAAAADIAKLTKSKSPSNSQVQADIRRLSRLSLAEKREDNWRIGDPMFEMWTLSRPREEFYDVS